MYQLRVSLRQTFLLLRKPQHHDDISYCIPPPSTVTWWSHSAGDAAGGSGGQRGGTTMWKKKKATFWRLFAFSHQRGKHHDSHATWLSRVVRGEVAAEAPSHVHSSVSQDEGEWNMSSQIWLVPPSRCISFTSRCVATKTTTTTTTAATATHVIQHYFVMSLNYDFFTERPSASVNTCLLAL